jgi:polysaccharide export outer membrane protein
VFHLMRTNDASNKTVRANRARLISPAMLLAAPFIALLATATGCSSSGESANWMLNGFLDPSQVGRFRSESRNEVRSVISILEEPMGIANTEEPVPDDHKPRYEEQRLAPGDAINITIFELMVAGQATESQIRLGNSGFETIPSIGRVRIAGLTPRELELELKRILREADVLADAEVQVTLLEARSQQYSILGAVQRPGTFGLPRPDYRLLQALAEAGGISPLIERVYVFRRGAGGGPVPDPGGNMTPGVDMTPVGYSMSDTGRTSTSGPAGTTRPANGNGDAPPTDSAPADSAPDIADLPGLAVDEAVSQPATSPAAAPTRPTAGPVDELEILEGRPDSSEPSISWDPARGGWVIDGVPATEPSAQPLAPAQPARQPAPADGQGIWDSDTDDASVRILEIPAKELLDGDSRYNIVIRPFDLINVPPGAVGEYYVQGNVARPGAYQMAGRRPTL